MEVILLENIINLGNIGDKVTVKNGYGRNFLLKQVKALRYNKENQEIVDKKKSELNKKIVVITRATLRWNRLLSIWNAVPRASKAIKNAKGVLYYKGIGEWPFIQQATISIWDNFKSINDFAYKDKIHSDIVKVTRKKKWYKEDLFSRFNLISVTTKKLPF